MKSNTQYQDMQNMEIYKMWSYTRNEDIQTMKLYRIWKVIQNMKLYKIWKVIQNKKIYIWTVISNSLRGYDLTGKIFCSI
jgi:hypothetical protein